MTTQRKRASEAGFTLIELLIVMSLILILMTLAIPGYEKIMKSAHEKSAIASLRALNMAEGSYSTDFPTHGYACTTAQLGGKSGAAPTPEAAGIIPEDLASGNKSGYTFTITCGAKTTINNVDQYSSYTITAVPISVGKTGDRGYCTEPSGQVRIDYKGGTNCTDLLQ